MSTTEIEAEKWNSCESNPPPEGVVLDTKIDDGRGDRNHRKLTRIGGLWFFPDASMYVYYTPTHWKIAQP